MQQQLSIAYRIAPNPLLPPTPNPIAILWLQFLRYGFVVVFSEISAPRGSWVSVLWV